MSAPIADSEGFVVPRAFVGAVLIPVDPDRPYGFYPGTPTLGLMQRLVGGYVERVPRPCSLHGRRCELWVDEDGTLYEHPRANPRATQIAAAVRARRRADRRAALMTGSGGASLKGDRRPTPAVPAALS